MSKDAIRRWTASVTQLGVEPLPDELPGSFARREYREFFTNTFRQVLWLGFWAGAGIAPTIVFSQGHREGGQVLVGLAVYLACVGCTLGLPYLYLRPTAAGRLLRAERAARAEREAQAAFPAALIAIDAIGYFDLTPAEHHVSEEKRVYLFEARATNRSERPLNLTFHLKVVWNPRPGISHEGDFWRLHRRAEDPKLLPTIVEVEPGRTRQGDLEMEGFLAEVYLQCDEESSRFHVRQNAVMRAVVEDLVSGQAVTFDVPGTWEST